MAGLRQGDSVFLIIKKVERSTGCFQHIGLLSLDESLGFLLQRMRILMIMLLCLLFSLQCRLWVGEGSMAQWMAVREQVALQKIENHRLAERNRQIAVGVVALQTGLDTVEEYARTELGMIRQDEEFFLMAD